MMREKNRSPILPNTQFRKRSTYEFLLTFQPKYSAMKKSSISSFPNSFVDVGGLGMAYACKPLGSWAGKPRIRLAVDGAGHPTPSAGFEPALSGGRQGRIMPASG